MSARAIRIGTHGSRGTGKTCYYASLYGKRTEGDAAIILADEKTVASLEADWQILSDGKRPEANAQTIPNELHYTITHHGHSPVTACDYAGALVQRNNNDAMELKGKVLAWLKKCDALFILVDTQRILSASQDDLREQQTEIGLLIAALQKGKRISKPLALVLTKWDLKSTVLLSPEEETQKAQQFIEEHKLLGDIAKGIALSGKYYKVFPVSAFGGHGNDGALPPADGIHPFNTLAPLVWCVDRVREIRKAQARNLAIGLAGFLASMAVLVGIMLDRNAATKCENTLRIMNDLGISTEEVHRQVESYINHWNPLTRARGRSEQIDAAYQDFQTRKQTDDYDNLTEPMESDDEANRAQNLAAYEAFLENWPASQHRVEVEGFLNRARTIYKRVTEGEAFKALVETCLIQVEGERDFSKRLLLLNTFLDEQPLNKVPEIAHDQRERIVRYRDDTITAIHNAEWQALITYIEQNANQHANCIEKIDHFLGANTKSLYCEQAQSKKREIESAWDKSTYEQLRKSLDEATRKPLATKDLIDLKRKMEEYRNRDYPAPAMKDNVHVWLRWFEPLENGTTIHVFVERVSIPQNSYLAHRWDGSIMLRAKIGQLTTKEVETKKGEPMAVAYFNERLQNITYKMGDRLSVHVVSRWGWTRGLPDRRIDVDIHPVLKQVDLMHEGKRSGTIYLRVKDQPDLPEYKGISEVPV